VTYWIGYFLILITIAGFLIVTIIFFHRSARHTLIVNSTLTLLTGFLVLMGLELYFKVFFAEPDALDTLARRNWREWYANKADRNSLGYRDIEWTDEMVTGKFKVMVVGDSFVYGDGIEDPKDRFSDILADKLGDDYAVFNVGFGGTNTKHHIEAIINYPYVPDLIILSYFINDIEGALLEEQWLNKPPRTPRLLPQFGWLERNSYAFNFLYWRLHRLVLAQKDVPDRRWEWYLSVYNHPDSWWLHQQQLQAIHDGTKAEEIELLVVVFPSMDHTQESLVVTERVIDFFHQRGTPVLDVSEIIQDIPQRDRMASAVDAHPSELIHQRVAHALYDILLAEKLID
jgi:hypothetical protein